MTIRRLILYPLKLLGKRVYRRRQRAWARALSEHLKLRIPAGVEAVAKGWMPGCEPLFQVEGLEWVELRLLVEKPSGINGFVCTMWLSHHFYYPEEPTEAFVAAICHELQGRCFSLSVS